MIDLIIRILTFIPWIIYYIENSLYRINILENKKCDKKKYFKYINNNFFESFNIRELVLFSIFIIFMQYNNTIVLEILFPAIYLYLLINFLHSNNKKHKKIKNKWLIVESILLLLLVVGFFVLTRDLYTTYIIMFIVSLLNFILVYIYSLIYSFLKK